MIRSSIVLAAALAIAASGAAARAQLRGENVLMPLPPGFKVGFQTTRNGTRITELVPEGETVGSWSRMVTQHILIGRGNVAPDALPRSMTAGWTSACPGGSAREVGTSTDNGYPATVWTFRCDLNPATGKPENMWMKVISGADSLYSVQYAYRSALTSAMVPPTMAYLRKVTVCDTRSAAHPCPGGT